jgi:glycosyltransferase involved in cell wall biosynthesis
MPLVSIITPCYNSRDFIARTIESVRGQTFRDWEHIVVDDGASDGSAEEVEKYLPLEPRLKLVRQPNGGVCNARNNGFQGAASASKYVLFLDADDCLEPEMLEVLVHYLEAHPRVGAVYCNYRNVDEQDTPMPDAPLFSDRYVPARLGVRRLPDGHRNTPFVSIFACSVVLPSACVLRRAVYEQTQGWDEELGQHGEERDLLLQIALKSQVHFLPCVLLRYRRHPNQSSVRHGNLEVQRQTKKFYLKWRSLPGLSYRQRKQCFQAWRFWEGRLAPHHRFQDGKRALRNGDLRFFVRHCGWAAGGSCKLVSPVTGPDQCFEIALRFIHVGP